MNLRTFIDRAIIVLLHIEMRLYMWTFMPSEEFAIAMGIILGLLNYRTETRFCLTETITRRLKLLVLASFYNSIVIFFGLCLSSLIGISKLNNPRIAFDWPITLKCLELTGSVLLMILLARLSVVSLSIFLFIDKYYERKTVEREK